MITNRSNEIGPPEPESGQTLDATHDLELLVIAGGSARVRQIRAAMSQAYRAFVDALSVSSRFNRFHVLGHTMHDSLIKQLTHVDQSSHVALAVFDDAHPGLMIAEARYVIDEQFHAEWAIAVADEWQRKGVGHALSSILLRHALKHHVTRVWGILQRGNHPMTRMARRLGFIQRHDPQDSTLLLIERAL